MTVCVIIPVCGQITTKSHRMDREIYVSYDNDMYFGTDQYYSSGANITYSRAFEPGTRLFNLLKSKRSDSLKVIGRFQYGHKIFTPSKIKKRRIEEFDRPYAGWHYIKLHIQNHPGLNMSNKYMLELGMVGKKSGIGNFHQWWHDGLDIPQPNGWEYEISNELIINMVYNRRMLWSPVKMIGVLTDTGVKVGNGINRASQELNFRLGKFNRLVNSASNHSRISNHIPVVGNSDREEEEGFVFYGIEGQYVLSNVFIEGSIVNKESQHMSELERYVIVRKWGFMYSNYYTTFSITFYRISPENSGARKHRYVSLNLSIRF